MQLARFGGALPAGQVARYQELVERFGEPAEPELLEGWVGPTAPLSTRSSWPCVTMSLWRCCAPGSRMPAGWRRRGRAYGRTLEEAAAQAPERFASLAPALAELHPAYAVGVLSGLGEAAKQGGAFAWQPVFEFAHTMIVGSRSLPVPDEDQDDELIRGWVDVRLQLARLLDAGLRHDRIPRGADSDVFEVLAALASDPDPSVADERRRGDGDAGPVTLALTTVRGVAFSAIMQYARWRRTKTPPGQTPRLGRQLRELLDRHLDPKQEPNQDGPLRLWPTTSRSCLPAMRSGCGRGWRRSFLVMCPWKAPAGGLGQLSAVQPCLPRRVRAAQRALPGRHRRAGGVPRRAAAGSRCRGGQGSAGRARPRAVRAREASAWTPAPSSTCSSGTRPSARERGSSRPPARSRPASSSPHRRCSGSSVCGSGG